MVYFNEKLKLYWQSVLSKTFFFQKKTSLLTTPQTSRCDVCKSMYLCIIYFLKYAPQVEKLQVWEKYKSKWRHSSVFLNRYPAHAWGGASILEAATLTIFWLLTSEGGETNCWVTRHRTARASRFASCTENWSSICGLGKSVYLFELQGPLHQRRAIPTNDAVCKI